MLWIPHFWVRGDPVQDDLGLAIAALALHAGDGAGVDRWPIAHQLLAERLHPRVILVELLATGDGAPWDRLMDVGVASVVAHVIVFQARPGRAGNDLAWLGLDVTEANRLVPLGHRQVAVVDAGEFRQRCPGFHRDMAVGFRRQGQDHFGSINGAVDFWPPLADTRLDFLVVQFAKEFNSQCRRFQLMPLPLPLPSFSSIGPREVNCL